MNSGESGTDRVRRHVRARYIDPARRNGRNAVTVRVGDVASDLHLRNRVPAVCSALGSKLLLEQSGLRLVGRRGPRQSTTTEFRHAIVGGRLESGTEDVTRRNPDPGLQWVVGNTFRDSTPPTTLTPGHTLFLVSCVKTKRNTLAPARDLYVSPWFLKARDLVERTGDSWRILSTQHGLLHPDEEVRPTSEH